MPCLMPRASSLEVMADLVYAAPIAPDPRGPGASERASELRTWRPPSSCWRASSRWPRHPSRKPTESRPKADRKPSKARKALLRANCRSGLQNRSGRAAKLQLQHCKLCKSANLTCFNTVLPKQGCQAAGSAKTTNRRLHWPGKHCKFWCKTDLASCTTAKAAKTKI